MSTAQTATASTGALLQLTNEELFDIRILIREKRTEIEEAGFS
jgi:hypothetical protein